MKVLILALLVAFAVCEGLKQTPPLLPEQFSAKFEEASVLVVTGITEGFWYYDSKNQMESIYRFNGRYDRYCGNIFKNQETPCRHVVVKGKRYLDFPERKVCCYCCDSSEGCGMLRRDFLTKDNARYDGIHQIDENGPYEKWKFFGGQENDYFHKDGIPRRISEVPIDYTDILSYTAGAPEASKFALPEYCQGSCGGSCPRKVENQLLLTLMSFMSKDTQKTQ